MLRPASGLRPEPRPPALVRPKCGATCLSEPTRTAAACRSAGRVSALRVTIPVAGGSSALSSSLKYPRGAPSGAEADSPPAAQAATGSTMVRRSPRERGDHMGRGDSGKPNAPCILGPGRASASCPYREPPVPPRKPHERRQGGCPQPRSRPGAELRGRVIPLPPFLVMELARAPLLPSPGGRLSGEGRLQRSSPETPPQFSATDR
ncbi:hypothetical protein PhaeoP75_04435 (plasmid) [Phaeobacter gallaeciensis]|uniref:Uncharacterized protein n=1 Tax=Phaeobacter gallaeciensis TaxID=60890 RepID=A0AAC9ZDW4_9RHOB|nr:hypothetical protein PhaeoP75_04435 [Phaeobacter gallaeciensis]ATF08310.1 hypothetical protein PhaeoP63_04280 [Phaeobacter gallaeciensis]